MQGDKHFHPKRAVPSLTDQVGNNYMHVPAASSFAAIRPPAAKNLPPVHGVEFQPSEVCPKNFIIFDQTDHRSQIVFHPAIAHKFSGSGFNIPGSYMPETFDRKDANDVIEREISSSLREDSEDIDALLSSDDDEQEEYDEEEVSTARTYGDFGKSSPDSISTYGSKLRKNGPSSSTQKSSGSGRSCDSERKRQKMKKMVKTIRGIVPGGDQMDTVTVLDEAVRYLKSLKVEAQKLGVGNFKSYT